MIKVTKLKTKYKWSLNTTHVFKVNQINNMY